MSGEWPVGYFSKFAGASAALTLTLIGPAASAAIVTATYTGSVSGTSEAGDTGGAFDNTGVFGALTDLEGLAYTAVFIFDTNLGLRATASDQDFLVGGSDAGVTSPLLSAMLTIEGVAHAFSASRSGVAFHATNGIDSAAQHLAAGDPAEGFLSAVLFNPTLPINVAGPFSGDYLAINAIIMARGEFLVGDQGVAAAHGYLLADHLTITSGGVPEPATWALMLIGFGGLGLMARRSRRVGLPVSA